MSLQDAMWQDYFVLLLFTGLRKSEALSLRWTDVDLDAKTILIRDTKNRQPHMLPLSDFLTDLFVRKGEQKTADFVFPGENGGRAADPRLRSEEIVKKSGITFTPHDLRRTFATVAESLDLSWKTVKSLLNPKMEDDVTAGYVVSDAERMRAAMQAITDKLKTHCGIDEPAKKAVAKAKPKNDSKVVNISSARKAR